MTAVHVAKLGLRSFKAQREASVVRVYENTALRIAEALEEGKRGVPVGVKDTTGISPTFLSKLETNGYFIHTLDKMAQGGRAIDMDLINPITGRYMTGSSSGTALNVFLGLNDLGIGTDGGGSVLAPALALNLFGIISPLLDPVVKPVKTSTDGIAFSPSVGLIAKDLGIIEECFKCFVPVEDGDYKPVYELEAKRLSYSYDRGIMMDELAAFDFDTQLLITSEGPIDLLGYGDSVMGHYDELTQEMQYKGGKYYLKVANMLGLTGIIIPSKRHASGKLILAKSEPKAIGAALKLAHTIPFERSPLETQYFDCLKGTR